MKLTPQISPKERGAPGFPLTDYNFQAAGDPKSSCSNVYPAKNSPPFHRLSSEFFGAEAYRDYVTNFLVFTVLGLVTAWPIFASIVAIVRMARGY